MDTTVDRRTIRMERDDEALAEVEARQPAWLEQELQLARLFCRIDRKAAFLAAGAASLEELATRRGFDGPRARELCLLGYALAAEPALEGRLRSGQVRFPAACALGRIFRDRTLPEPEDRWLDWARDERLPDLRRRIGQRIESVRQQRPAERPWNAHVTFETAERLGRCRRIASHKAGRMLTNGQLLEVFATGYLLEHDPLERTARARRMPPTRERPGDRTIPAEVSRALEERSGGLCEFGACERPGVEICHVVPHREGGGREVLDLVRGCRLHHKAYDAGWIRFLAWSRSEDPALADLPVFQTVETGELLTPKPRPNPDRRRRPPGWLVRAVGARLGKRLRGDPQERGPPPSAGP